MAADIKEKVSVEKFEGHSKSDGSRFIRLEIKDDKGGKLFLFDHSPEEFSNALGKVSQVSFGNASGETNLWPDTVGFTGKDTIVIAGNPHTMSVSALMKRDDSSKKLNGVVLCEGRKRNDWKVGFGAQTRDDVKTSMHVVEATGRKRLEDFLTEHPAIEEYIKGIDPTITMLNGKPATYSELGKFPSQYTACPKDKKSTIVKGPA